MSEYLTYKFNINSTEFLDFLNLKPSDVDSYQSMITYLDNDIDIIQSNVSYAISFIDFAVNTYSNYGFEGYLTPSSNSSNTLLETTASVAGIEFSSSIEGSNLLAPFGNASYPMGITQANFSINEAPFYGELSLSGDVSINVVYDWLSSIYAGYDVYYEQWSGYYSSATISAPFNSANSDFFGNQGDVSIRALAPESNFNISGTTLTSDGLIEYKAKIYDPGNQSLSNEMTYEIDTYVTLNDTDTLGDTPSFSRFDVKSLEFDFQSDGSVIEAPLLINSNIWTTLNNLNHNSISSPVSIELDMPRNDYSFALPFTLTEYGDLFDVKGLNFTVDMGGGDDVATVYQDHGTVNGGSGVDSVYFSSLSESSVTINQIDNNGVTEFHISSPSSSSPITYILKDVEKIKFQGQSDYSEINNYKTNQPPEFTSSPIISVLEDQTYTYQISTSDDDGDLITISTTVLPDWLTLNDDGNNSVSLTGTPNDYYVGENAVEIMISDGENVNYQRFNINVQDVDNDPRPITEYFELTGDNTLDMLLQGSKWVFPSGVDRVLDWAIVDDGLTTWYPDEGVIYERIDYVLDNIQEFVDLEFNFLGWYGSDNEANAAGSEINYIASDLDGAYAMASFTYIFNLPPLGI